MRSLSPALAVAIAGLLLKDLRRPRIDPRLRHALVTGGSRGLGFAIARELLSRGVRVSTCGRDAETLARARERLSPHGEIELFRADLAEPGDVDALLQGAREAHGPVDLLVNNAAIIQVGPLEAIRYEDFERTLSVNVLAPLRLVLAVLPWMRERSFGRIVNIGSVGGRLSAPHLLPYTTSKFALTGLSEGLRAELSGSGVRVTTVSPGLTRTGSSRHAEFRGRHREEHAWFAVADALPLLSGDARRTARRTVDAALRGDAELVTTLPARVATTLHGLVPGLTSRLLGLSSRWLLPRADGVQSRSRRGRESRSQWAPSALTRLDDRAARDLNQEPHSRSEPRAQPSDRGTESSAEP